METEKTLNKPTHASLIMDLSYASIVLPYFGYLDQVAVMLKKLWKGSNKLLNENLKIFWDSVFKESHQIRVAVYYPWNQ